MFVIRELDKADALAAWNAVGACPLLVDQDLGLTHHGGGLPGALLDLRARGRAGGECQV
jgi:hypothetical protein